jgi:tetratricopeptide (TPR) repeat protein
MSEQNAIELCRKAKEALSADLEGAIALAYLAIDSVNEENRALVLPELYYVLAVAHHRIGKNTISIEYFTKRLEFAQESENENLLAGTHNNIGTVLSSVSEYATAMEHFYKALTIYEAMGAQQQVAVTKTNLGVAYKNHNRLDDALNMLNQSLDYALSSNNIKLAINNYLNIGNIMNIKKQYADAATLLKKQNLLR